MIKCRRCGKEFAELVDGKIPQHRRVDGNIPGPEQRLTDIDICKESGRSPTRVQLTYFKDSGKYYSSGEYYSDFCGPNEFWDVLKEVQSKMRSKSLPGLIQGHSEFHVHMILEGESHHPPHFFPRDSV